MCEPGSIDGGPPKPADAPAAYLLGVGDVLRQGCGSRRLAIVTGDDEMRSANGCFPLHLGVEAEVTMAAGEGVAGLYLTSGCDVAMWEKVLEEVVAGRDCR